MFAGPRKKQNSLGKAEILFSMLWVVYTFLLFLSGGRRREGEGEKGFFYREKKRFMRKREDQGFVIEGCERKQKKEERRT